MDVMSDVMADGCGSFSESGRYCGESCGVGGTGMCMGEDGVMIGLEAKSKVCGL